MVLHLSDTTTTTKPKRKRRDIFITLVLGIEELSPLLVNLLVGTSTINHLWTLFLLRFLIVLQNKVSTVYEFKPVFKKE